MTANRFIPRELLAPGLDRWRRGRRDALKTLGLASLLAPFASYRRAHAQPGEVDNLFIATFPDGIEGDWHPTGGTTGFTLSQTLAPFAPYREKMLFVSGLRSGIGIPINAHGEGNVTQWTGALTHTKYATNPSIDQVIADAIGKQTTFRSLHAGAQAMVTPREISQPFVHYGPNEQPIPADDDPNSIYSLLARSITGGSLTDPDVERMRLEKRSVLDYVRADLTRLQGQIAAADRVKLEEHATRIRDLERILDTGAVATCPRPAEPRMTREAALEHANFEPVAKLQVDQLALALQCGLTKVVTMQFSVTDCELRIERLNTTKTLHGAAHGGSAAERLEWSRFMIEQVAYVLEKLNGVDMGNGQTLLDRTLVVIGTEMSFPTHGAAPMPFFIAGGQNGYFRKNTFLDFGARGDFFGTGAGPRHTKLLTNILQAMGLPHTSYGQFTDSDSTGSLAEVRS